MSTLLSRFRRTVLPSTSSSKKHSADDGRQYNYRKPTKSFNEKSVKTRSSQPCTDAHEDTSHQQPQHHHHHHQHSAREIREKPNRSSSKLSKSSMLNTNRTTKNRTNDSMDNSALSRSNTFTLEDEANFQNGTYPRSKKKEKTPIRERNADADYDERKSKQPKEKTKINFNRVEAKQISMAFHLFC